MVGITNIDCLFHFKELPDPSQQQHNQQIKKKNPLKAFRHAKNLKDLLVRSSLLLYLETFRNNQQQLSHLTGPFAAHVPMSIHLPQ